MSTPIQPWPCWTKRTLITCWFVQEQETFEVIGINGADLEKSRPTLPCDVCAAGHGFVLAITRSKTTPNVMRKAKKPARLLQLQHRRKRGGEGLSNEKRN